MASLAGLALRFLCAGCRTAQSDRHPQAVDNRVDGAVESSDAQGINGRCPVDDKRILELRP